MHEKYTHCTYTFTYNIHTCLYMHTLTHTHTPACTHCTQKQTYYLREGMHARTRTHATQHNAQPGLN